MISSFETGVRIDSSACLFTFTDRDSKVYSYSYWESRLIAASLARKLRSMGITSGDTVMIDLPNCPEFVFFSLACAYAEVAMLLIDHSLPSAEKISRRLEVERSGISVSLVIDTALAEEALAWIRNLPDESSEIVKQIFSSRRNKSIMGENQDVIDDTIHYAERAAHLFDINKVAIILFAGDARDVSLKRSTSKIVALTWYNLLESAYSSIDFFSTEFSRLWQERLPFNTYSHSSTNVSMRSSTSGSSVSERAETSWQSPLPLYSIAGFQALVRAIVMRTPIALYTGFEPEQLLHDVERGRATHVVVDDATLQDMMTVEEWRNDANPVQKSRLSLYKGMFLTGRVPSSNTISRAIDLGARLFVGYGMAQTSGAVAIALITEDRLPGLMPLGGYEIHIIDPDEDGCGRIAIKGPGVFGGYINTRTPYTLDQFFITEDKAVLENGRIYVRNRAQNMFVSAGQNIYPVEIADILRHVEGVSSVHVFGVPDTRCGMLPIAVLERNNQTLTSQYVAEQTRNWFEDYPVPISVFVFDELPRNEMGKLNRHAIEAFFAS